MPVLFVIVCRYLHGPNWSYFLFPQCRREVALHFTCDAVFRAAPAAARFLVRHGHKVADLLFHVFVQLTSHSFSSVCVTLQENLFSRGLGRRRHVCDSRLPARLRDREAGFLPPDALSHRFLIVGSAFSCLCDLDTTARGFGALGDCQVDLRNTVRRDLGYRSALVAMFNLG